MSRALRSRVLAALLMSGIAQPLAAQRIVPPGAELDVACEGGTFLEGPAAAPDGTIFFSDISVVRINGIEAGHILRFDPRTKQMEIYRSPSNQANGLAFDQGSKGS